jgi:hypothetical protein
MINEILIWFGIFFCLTQSAIFSGLNLAFFSLTRLRLEIEAESASETSARNVLAMRNDSNFLLTTILWGNVGINVLLTLLSDSVMVGVTSFAFSTVVITLFGEIIPQAYFSRHALRMASLLAPILKFYQLILYPVAKPSAMLLDKWLGKESAQFFREENIKLFIKKHIEDHESEIDHIEGTGAINFLSLDDLQVSQEGEQLHQESIIQLETIDGKIIFPDFVNHPSDPFVQRINKSEEKWIIFTDEQGHPQLALDADGFIRSLLFEDRNEPIKRYCHAPLVITDVESNLGALVESMKHMIDLDSDQPIPKDVVLIWGHEQKRIITGADLLGRLLSGI